MNPPFNDPFSVAYDELSMHHSELPKHAGCYVYTPDNYDDYQCLAIWQPTPELGAREWIRNGKRILIGLYRDEGRATQVQPLTEMTWTRTFDVLTASCSKAHHMLVGDKVTLEGINVLDGLTATVTAVTALTFQATTSASGSSSGTGFYSPEKPINFAEEHIIFRLLPLFKPVSIATVLEILDGADPQQSRSIVNLTNIQSGDVQATSEITTRSTSVLYRRHRQQLDELNRPLTQTYDTRGRVIKPDLRFNKHSNAKLYVNVPMVNQHDPIPTQNARLPTYDYYGFDLNDPTRGPFYRTDIVGYSSQSAVGLSRYENNGTPVYSGVIHDVFGDYVVGARSNNTLITRKPVQPLLIDHHNTPYKRPIGRG